MRTACFGRAEAGTAGGPCHRESGCGSVLGGEAHTGGGPLDWLAQSDHSRVRTVVGCSLAEAAVGPVGVVVAYGLFEKLAQLALIPYPRPVEQFVADGSDPSLNGRVGPGSAGWDGDDRAVDCCE